MTSNTLDRTVDLLRRLRADIVGPQGRLAATITEGFFRRFSCHDCSGKCCHGEVSGRSTRDYISLDEIHPTYQHLFKPKTIIVNGHDRTYWSAESTTNPCMFLELGRCVLWEDHLPPMECYRSPQIQVLRPSPSEISIQKRPHGRGSQRRPPTVCKYVHSENLEYLAQDTLRLW